MSLRIRVLASRRIYRREGDVGGQGAHHAIAQPHWDLLDLLFMAELISSDSEDISWLGFLK